jgi:hypothetical protein
MWSVRKENMQAKAGINRSALLVIDAQDSFKVAPRWERRNNAAFEENVQRDSDDSEHFQANSPYFKLMSFIQPKPMNSDREDIEKLLHNHQTGLLVAPSRRLASAH